MKLHEYQNRIVEKIGENDRLVLSVGMGLGKTASVLHAIDRYRPESVLIVAPKRVAETVWLNEAYKWLLTNVYEKMVECIGSPKKRAQALNKVAKTIKIIGRDNLKDVEGMSFDWLVIDELTSFKNPLSARSQAIYSIRANKKIGLTGSFLANGFIDVYGQFGAIGVTDCSLRVSKNGRYKWCPKFESWRAMYFYDVVADAGVNFHKWRLKVDLSEALRPFQRFIFTLDSADYLEIPEVTYYRHNIELCAKSLENYLQMSATMQVDINGDTLAFDEQSKFCKLQTLANGFVYDADGVAHRTENADKLTAVADFVEQCAGENEQVLLFYAFREECALLCELLNSRGLRVANAKDSGFLNKWNNHDVDVLMAHPASAGHGLNLQDGGRICVWSSITYNFEYWAQANARLARQGQAQAVQIHVFASAGTIEQKQFKAVMQKQNENAEFIDLTK